VEKLNIMCYAALVNLQHKWREGTSLSHETEKLK
jgi:hypothetical protein